MNLGLSVGLGGRSGGGFAPVSLITTADLTLLAVPAVNEILSPTSFRAARNVTGNGGFSVSTIKVPPGTYRLTGTFSAYDGAEAGITGPSFRLQDNFVTLGNGSFAVPGPIDVTFTFATQLQFRPVASATGFRFDELFLVPA